jgi:hypothetical protein
LGAGQKRFFPDPYIPKTSSVRILYKYNITKEEKRLYAARAHKNFKPVRTRLRRNGAGGAKEKFFSELKISREANIKNMPPGLKRL